MYKVAETVPSCWSFYCREQNINGLVLPSKLCRVWMNKVAETVPSCWSFYCREQNSNGLVLPSKLCRVWMNKVVETDPSRTEVSTVDSSTVVDWFYPEKSVGFGWIWFQRQLLLVEVSNEDIIINGAVLLSQLCRIRSFMSSMTHPFGSKGSLSIISRRAVVKQFYFLNSVESWNKKIQSMWQKCEGTAYKGGSTLTFFKLWFLTLGRDGLKRFNSKGYCFWFENFAWRSFYVFKNCLTMSKKFLIENMPRFL